MISQKFKWVNWSRIAPGKKPEAWARLKRLYPAQARLLKDPYVTSLRVHFPGCQVSIALPVND